jgi:ATP-binding cassette subfamily B protein
MAYQPLVIGDAIDAISNGAETSVILNYALIAVGLVLVGGTFLFLTRQNIIVVSREIENDLRYDFFSHLQRLPKSFYNSRTTGDLMNHAISDINNIRNFLGPGIMYSMQTFTRLIITLYILFNINVKVTIIALAPLPVISLAVYLIGRLTYNRSLKVQESLSDLTTKAQETFSGIRVIKSFMREQYENLEFDKKSRDFFHKSLKLAKVQAFSFPMMFLLTGLSIILVLYFGGVQVMEGNMTIGNIGEYIIYLGQLTWPMIAFGWIINLIQRAAPSMKRFKDITDIEPEIADGKHTNHNIKERDIEGEILFKNVSFKYPGSENFVLKNVNLKIHKGTVLGIIGATGSGKTTLVNLLPRVFDPTSGQITLDGYPLNIIPINVLRNSIGIVPQESFLFSTSIGKNIAYSSDVIDDLLMIESSKQAGLYKDVAEFPRQFDTILGERGITLSGGQKQRTSIARAIYKQPKILILDDSLSAVDTNTEEEILSALKSIMKDRTSIIISHRISTIKNANNIIVLRKGMIAEEGTHNELLAMKGIYFDIYQKQLLEEQISKL